MNMNSQFCSLDTCCLEKEKLKKIKKNRGLHVWILDYGHNNLKMRNFLSKIEGRLIFGEIW